MHFFRKQIDLMVPLFQLAINDLPQGSLKRNAFERVRDALLAFKAEPSLWVNDDEFHQNSEAMRKFEAFKQEMATAGALLREGGYLPTRNGS